MDPIRTLLDFLSEHLPKVDAAFEAQIREIFARFELVPKADFEAHLDVLRSLEAEVKELEARIARLEPTE